MRTLTDDVHAALDAAGLTVGRSTGEGLTAPFVVVYPLIQSRDGSLSDAFSDVTKFYEARCVGVGEEQAEWLADEVEAALHVSALVLTELTRSGLSRDDDTAAPPLFTVYVRARFRTYAPEAV